MKAKRYVYFKASNAAKELTLIGPSPGSIPEGGPTLYVASFLHLIGDNPAQLHGLDRSSETTRLGNVVARTHPYTNLQGPLAPLRKAGVLLSILFALLRFRPRIIVCPIMGSPIWVSALAATLTGAKLIHSRHNISVRKPGWRGALSNWLNAKALLSASAAICHGRFLAEELQAEGMETNRILPYDPDFSEFQTAALAGTQDIVPENTPYILYAGRITENKGGIDLLDAALPILTTRPDYFLVFAGDGPARETIRRLADEKGVGRQVLLPGMLPYESLGPLIRDARIVVTPTQQRFPEGRCKVVAEAHVLGRPVIAPNFGPFAHYLTHDVDGLLYEPDSVEQLAAAINSLAQDSERLKRLSEGAFASGKRIRKPSCTFLAALQQAFMLAEASLEEGNSNNRKRTHQ